MGGKAAMFLVMGFSIIFLVFGNNFNNLSTRSVDNNSNYYINNMAHNIAVAGANIAANKVFMDKTWDDGFYHLPYQGGVINVYVTNPDGSTSGGKITICHNYGKHNAHTISIGAPALPAHLAHGDHIGACGTTATDMVVIYAEGIYPDPSKISAGEYSDTSSVYVELQPSTFAKYGNFYDKLSAIPATGDVFEGPFHVNDKMKTYGSPEFFGKVTSKKSLTMYGTKDPIFHGGYENGVDVPRPFDTTGMRVAGSTGGLVLRAPDGSGDEIDVEITLKDKKVEIEILGYDDDDYDDYEDGGPLVKETIKLEDINGMIYAEKANIYLKGTIDGAATIVASKKGKNGYGNIFQTDDIEYKDDITKKTDSDNMLGLVAEENFRIQYNSDTRHKDIETHASIFASNGDVGPDDKLRINDGKLASWNILGGVIAHDIRATAYYNWAGNPYKGYKYVHSYDARFLHTVPPFFPHTQNYEIVSWYE